MSEFLDKLRSCIETPEGGLECGGDPRASAVVTFIYGVYGGPIYSVSTCPAGPEPPSPNVVLQSMESAMPFDIAFTSEEQADLTEFILGEYQQAHAAWKQRIQNCPELPPDKTKKPSKSKSADVDTFSAVGLLAIVIGLYLLGRSR